MLQRKKASLLLEDGSLFHGFSFGAEIPTQGEIVFNTGMMSYPESMTDPSYAGQVIVFTYPLIGNYGVPAQKREHQIVQNMESEKIQCRAIIVAEYSDHYAHPTAAKSLEHWLKEEKISALTGIDTRALTKKLREHGTMLGKIIFDTPLHEPFLDPNEQNLVASVSTKQRIVYGDGPFHILVIDCGIKHGILRSLSRPDTTLIRVPWDYDFTDEIEMYDGIVISNGPGDPKMCDKTIQHLRQAIQTYIPLFGICLGIQLLALAAGANTYKLKYGHRSQNQPCIDLITKRCFITAQNHGFAIEKNTLPESWNTWFINANDGTIEGIQHATKPIFAVQFHPEACSGPKDTSWLFDYFLQEIKKYKQQQTVLTQPHG
ncbi:glutamine-hydrolyzing carbamoyl-phosphate synthase small subunit [Candidatus Woesearchaeota archaeon]|nr:glutamine-hydrolyzing carbamoyl-phosphate synthase small subunit [Candidatus Woesearchaeota archaeon]